MAIRSAATLPIAAPYAQVFDATHRALLQAGMDIRFADPSQGYIQASHGMGLASYGENLDIRVRATGATSTEVDITSALKFGVFDWGKNQKNVTKIQAAIMEALGASGPATAQQAPPPPQGGAWHPDPSGRHELRWFDGQQWTESISDAGVPGTDPI